LQLPSDTFNGADATVVKPKPAAYARIELSTRRLGKELHPQQQI
jgi:hypothetical protein